MERSPLTYMQQLETKVILATTSLLALSGCTLQFDSESEASEGGRPAAASPAAEAKATPEACSSLAKRGFLVEATNGTASLDELATKHQVPAEAISDFSTEAGLSNKDVSDNCAAIPVSRVSKLSDGQFKGMDGLSWRKGCLPGEDSLRLVTVPFRTYQNKSEIGQVVMNAKVAEATASTFQDIYAETTFQIESVRPLEQVVDPSSKTNSLVDAAQLDSTSMEKNNTLGFTCRNAVGVAPEKVSSHGMGMAVDVNPRTNPHIVDGTPTPPNAEAADDRSTHIPGLISREDPDGSLVIDIFEKNGFTWGGDNEVNKDYQHFVSDE